MNHKEKLAFLNLVYEKSVMQNSICLDKIFFTNKKDAILYILLSVNLSMLLVRLGQFGWY